MTVANTTATPVDNGHPKRTTLECRPSSLTATDGREQVGPMTEDT